MLGPQTAAIVASWLIASVYLSIQRSNPDVGHLEQSYSLLLYLYTSDLTAKKGFIILMVCMYV